MRKTHGKTKTSTYWIWAGMKTRCLNQKSDSYFLYGARGISVCPRWLNFINFLEDMGERPSKKHSLDRIDNNGNYEPGNCRWATWLQQAANKRARKKYSPRGYTTLTQISEMAGITRQALYERINKFGSLEAALRYGLDSTK